MKTENQQKIQQQVKKHLRNSLVFMLGTVGSLGILGFGVKEGWQTFRQEPVPRHIEFIKDEMKPLVLDLVLDLERYLVRDFERYFEFYFDRYFERDLEFYLDSYLMFDLVPNLRLNSEHNLEHNLERYFERNLVLDLEFDFERYFERNLVPYYKRYLDRYLVIYSDSDLELYFERDFPRKMIKIKFYSLLLERRIVPEKDIEPVAKLLLKELNQTLEISQNLGLTENQEFLTIEQKQSKLIQFSLLATLSAIGLGTFLLLLIKQRNQGVTWSMTGMYLLPEHFVAEMETLCEALQADKVPEWKIRLVMLWNVVDFLKSFYIQVKIEDLFLPNENTSD